eukprot:CAMPEP_0113711248 /NCGR_PEP_ID=MMETSP0038_2-20120614/30647_1 /TAXON_ID=2898 /ORGANISM="Cryptomonas paramecium" /LENGTH=65 /DNA_ID=CAMNT_0000637475 /DNA_START=77 /DNA_END=274 /DNA_ORIENTATION=- /assembly_acc=CAM_ASM_000170
MTSNNKISNTFVESVCYDAMGCCADILGERSPTVSLPSKSADELDATAVANVIAGPVLSRNLQIA